MKFKVQEKPREKSRAFTGTTLAPEERQIAISLGVFLRGKFGLDAMHQDEFERRKLDCCKVYFNCKLFGFVEDGRDAIAVLLSDAKSGYFNPPLQFRFDKKENSIYASPRND